MNLSRTLLTYSAILSISLVGCLPASRRAIPERGKVEARQAVEQSISAADIAPDRRRVVNEAGQWLGVPYRYGGSTPAGVDCSGFVCNVYRSAVEQKLPRTSGEQALVGQNIAITEALPGDLVFFNTMGSGVSHVGILINTDQFIHASTSNGVTVSSLSEPYYHDRFLFARRVLL